MFLGPLIRQYSQPSCTGPWPHQFKRGARASAKQEGQQYCLIADSCDSWAVLLASTFLFFLLLHCRRISSSTCAPLSLLSGICVPISSSVLLFFLLSSPAGSCWRHTGMLPFWMNTSPRMNTVSDQYRSLTGKVQILPLCCYSPEWVLFDGVIFSAMAANNSISGIAF